MSVGCIHGRFQPFHNGHFEYLLAAYQRCEKLIVGITQYDPEVTDAGSPAHRMDRHENPFSYWERMRIIRAVIDRSGLPPSKIEIVPFPIHAPQKVRNFVDPNCIMFTTVYDAWNIQKIRRLREQGFEVCILWRRRVKEIEGKKVRAAMRQDLKLFEELVPNGVAEAIRQIGKGDTLRVEASAGE